MTKTVTLGEICEIIAGQSPPSDTYNTNGIGLPFYQGKADFGQLYPKTRMWCSQPQKIAQPEDILLSVRAPVGPTNFCQEKSCIGRGLTALRTGPSVTPTYLMHYLRSIEQELANKANGSTFSAITQADVKVIPIPLPSLPEQRRIAALLDRADALRQKDRQLLAHYDKLAQSIFLDLFGDPMKNEKGWERVKIRDLVREVKYGTSKPAEDKGAFPYLRMNNITYEGHWNFTDLKYINLTKAEEPKYLLQKGDLVFNRTNSKELVGKTAVYQRDDHMAIAGYLIRSRVNDKATPEYISAYLNSKHGKATLKGMCKNIIGMANINAQELQEIDILQPPLSLQTHFARLIEQIERQKAVVRQQMAASEGLFGRLLQECFG